MNILVTGGAGYIGSHTCVELLMRGYKVYAIDNFINSSPESLARVEQITGKDVKWFEFDLLDQEQLDAFFVGKSIDAVIHFAALKAVNESIENPLAYYQNNVESTIALLKSMIKSGVKNIVFSSSATVYGSPEKLPIDEDHSTEAVNPYGRTKLFVEQILTDLVASDPAWSASILRYFNPIGAHETGLIGEDPRGIPNNLVPYIAQVAVGRRAHLEIFGDDYETPDGTAIRDYIHVVDLARGHISALEKGVNMPGRRVYNLGTGTGSSVLDVVNCFERVTGVKIARKIVGRRAGDVSQCYADTKAANQELGWRAEYTLEKMLEDTWRWQSQNPNGFCS